MIMIQALWFDCPPDPVCGFLQLGSLRFLEVLFSELQAKSVSLDTWENTIDERRWRLAGDNVTE
jgi:hypothetical protein